MGSAFETKSYILPYYNPDLRLAFLIVSLLDLLEHIPAVIPQVRLRTVLKKLPLLVHLVSLLTA